MAQRLTVEIVGDASSLERTFRRTAQQSSKFEAQIKGVGRATTGALAAAGAGFVSGRGLIAGFESSIAAASDLSEQMSKTNQVFGDSAQEVQTWAQTTATAFGISRREALATASSFGALFAPMGLVGEKAAQQSRRLTELGADLASFYNTDVQDALDAIRSGIVGESEPLRRYGVLLSESRVQAEALSETHKKSATNLTAAEKALARITLVFKDTSKAQGDFARTSEGMANQSRILKAQIDNLKTSIGEFYLPGLTDITSALNQELELWLNTSQQLADAPAGAALQASLVPRLAEQYGQLRAQGMAAGDAIKQLEHDLGDTGKAALLVGQAINYFAGGKVRGDIQKLRDQIKGVGDDADTMAKQTAARRATPEQRNTWFDAMISRQRDRVQDIPTLKGQVARLNEIAALIQQRIAATKDITRQLSLEDQLAEVQRTIRGDEAQITADQKQRDDDAKHRQKDALQAARDRAISAAALAVQRAGLTKKLTDDLAALKQQVVVLKQQHAAASEVLAAQLAVNEKEAEIAQAQADRAANRVQGQLDAANLAVARAGLTDTLKDDLARNEDLLAVMKRTHASAIDIVNQQIRIKDLKQQWADQVAASAEATRRATDSLTGEIVETDRFRRAAGLSNRRIADILGAGLGLDRAGRSRLLFNVAKSDVRLDVGVNIDGREVGRAVRRDNAGAGYRTARQTSGLRG